MQRWIVTHERNSEGWEFGSYSALVLDAESPELAAEAYVAVLKDPKCGIDVEAEDVPFPTEFGVVPMVPVGKLTDVDFVASGPDRKHSSEAFDALFRYYQNPIRVHRQA